MDITPVEFVPLDESEPTTTSLSTPEARRLALRLFRRYRSAGDAGTTTSAAPERAMQEPATNTETVGYQIADHWGELARSGLSQRTFAKLLAAAARRSGPPLQSASLTSFLAFWRSVRTDAKEPLLGLAPDGSIHAEWYKSPKQHLDIKFGPTKLFFESWTGAR
jgi:hypothetical protein